jgi:hypothetical protein
LYPEPDAEAPLEYSGSPSISMVLLPIGSAGARVEITAAGGLAILMPLAAAIFRSSFSSRFRSFSLRLSTSSCGMRMFACMSLKRALW